HRRTGRQLVTHHIAEPRLKQHDVDVDRKLLPELVCQILLTRYGSCLRGPCPTAQRFLRLIDRREDLGDAEYVHRPLQSKAADGTTHRIHHLSSPQLDEKLLKIGEADVLPLGNLAQ